MLKQSKAKRSSRRSSAGTVIFEGLKRATLGYRAYAYDVTTAIEALIAGMAATQEDWD